MIGYLKLPPYYSKVYSKIVGTGLKQSRNKMHRQDSWVRARSATTRFLHLLQTTQIEHQGQYSIHRLQTLDEYIKKKFTTRRLVGVLFLTPWPSAVVVVLMEFAPLNPPSLGAKGNAVFWARLAAISIIQSIGFFVLGHLGVPSLNLTILECSIATICATIASVVIAYACAIGIGFPVPFVMQVVSVPWITVMTLIVGGFSFRRIAADPNTILLLKEWIKACGVTTVQFFVYPLYNYVFRLASSQQQIALSIVLGIIKIGFRYAIGKTIKQQADHKPEIVTFNAEIFHAMFVAFTMQNTTSIMTVGMLLIVDLLHASTVVYDVHAMVQRLEALSHSISFRENGSVTNQRSSVIDCAVELVLRRQATIIQVSSANEVPSLCPHNDTTPPKMSWCDNWRKKSRSRNIKVHVTSAVIFERSAAKPPPKTTPLPALILSTNQKLSGKNSKFGNAEDEYIDTTLQLLHLMEFTMLGELVEFVVPIIYRKFSHSACLTKYTNKIWL